MKNKSNRLKVLGWAATLILLISGCYPKGPEYISDYGLVVTDYDTEFDFGSRKTYYMPDTIGFETNADDLSEEILREFEELILNTVAENMENRNYDRIDTSAVDPPDLFIGIRALAIENSGVGWVPAPCWSWYCWYYPNWYPVGYSYSTGTVIIQMGKPDEILNFDDITANVAWVAGLDGLLSSNVSNNAQSISNGINQAFTQSPYIQSNQ